MASLPAYQLENLEGDSVSSPEAERALVCFIKEDCPTCKEVMPVLNLTLPRIRDFQGLDTTKFDSDGNYNLGIKDQLIFPEIEYEQVDQILGLNISIVTTAKSIEESKSLLTQIGLPFPKV